MVDQKELQSNNSTQARQPPGVRKIFRDEEDVLREISRRMKESWVSEAPIETPNGITLRFTTSRTFSLSTLSVYLNGLRQTEGDEKDFRVVDEGTIEFRTAPLIDDRILIDFIPQEV